MSTDPRAPEGMERAFRRSLGDLERVFEFTAAFVSAAGFGPSAVHPISFILEELFTNAVRHQPSGGPWITVRLERDGTAAVIRLIDRDVDPFDITAAGEIDVEAPLARRRVGGLGIHLIRRMADAVDYSYTDRTSTITVRKTMEE